MKGLKSLAIVVFNVLLVALAVAGAFLLVLVGLGILKVAGGE